MSFLKDLVNPLTPFKLAKKGIESIMGGSSNISSPPYTYASVKEENTPPDPMLTLMPFMQSMMGAMAEFSASAISSLGQLQQIPQMPEPFQSPFRDWADERNKLQELIQKDPNATPRRGRASTVLTSLLDRDDDDVGLLHGELKGAK